MYVETPKAGCTSVKHSIISLYGSDYRASALTMKAEKTSWLGVHDRSLITIPSLMDFDEDQAISILQSRDYMRFCLVRNPFMRLSAIWLDRMLCRSISPLNSLVKAIGFPSYRADIEHLRLEFAQFVDHLYKHEAPSFSNHHWWRMVDLLLPDILSYDCIVRVENSDGMLPIQQHVSNKGLVWPGTPHFNGSFFNLGLELYSEIAFRRVLAMYEEDFDKFNYDKCPVYSHSSTRILPDEHYIRSIQERNERISFLSLRARNML